MSAQSPVPKDHPLMIAWEAYKATGGYANTKRWAAKPEHTEGSLWAAFMAGFNTPKPARVEGWAPTHRHIKTGGLYRLVSSAVLQTQEPVGDNEFLALYQGEDGLYWVRPADEFKDGRFAALTAALSTAPAKDGEA